MKENFSKRVQNIMKYGKEEAIRLGHSYIGSEHLLLALLRETSGKSAKIFDIYDCDIDDIRSMIEDMIKTSGGTMTLGHLPLTRRAERILKNAYVEAKNNNGDMKNIAIKIMAHPDLLLGDVLKIKIVLRY